MSLNVVCWILISACSPLSLLHTVPASAAVTLWGRGRYVVGTQRMPLNTERILHTVLSGGMASLPVGKPQGWSPPGCPVAFVCVQLSTPVHQPEWAHSGPFMRLADPGRLDTIS